MTKTVSLFLRQECAIVCLPKQVNEVCRVTELSFDLGIVQFQSLIFNKDK